MQNILLNQFLYVGIQTTTLVQKFTLLYKAILIVLQLRRQLHFDFVSPFAIQTNQIFFNFYSSAITLSSIPVIFEVVVHVAREAKAKSFDYCA